MSLVKRMWKLKYIKNWIEFLLHWLSLLAIDILCYTLEHKLEQQQTELRWFGQLPALFLFWTAALTRNSLDICMLTKEETEQQLEIHNVAASSGISQEPGWGYYRMSYRDQYSQPVEGICVLVEVAWAGLKIIVWTLSTKARYFTFLLWEMRKVWLQRSGRTG